MKPTRLSYFNTALSMSLLLVFSTMASGEPAASSSEKSKQAEKPIVIGPYEPVGQVFDHATGSYYLSHNPLLDQYVGKLVTVRGEFFDGKGGRIGDVTIQNDLGDDPEYVRSLNGKQVECTGVLVKSIVEHGIEVQAAEGTHYNLEDNGPVKPVTQNDSGEKSSNSPANGSTESGDITEQSKKPVVIDPYKPVGHVFDHTKGIFHLSHNPLLDQYVGKLVTVRGEFSYGKGGQIGNVTIQNKLGDDPEYVRSLNGKQVECTGVLVKIVVEPGKIVQAVPGTHYKLENNGPIKPLSQSEPEKKRPPGEPNGR